VRQVKTSEFPAPENWFGINDAHFDELKEILEERQIYHV